MLLLSYAWFVQGGGWNSNSRLALTRALVERRSLSIDPYHGATGDKALSHGRWYTDKSPGPSWLAAPVYGWAIRLLGRTGPFASPVDGAAWLCVLAVVALPSALAGTLLLKLLALRLGAGLCWSLVLATGYGLGTLAFPYSTLFYNHQLAASLSFAAFYLAWTRPAGRPLAAGRGAVIGTLLGWAAISDYATLLAALVVGVILLARLPGRAAIAVALGGFLLPVVAFLGYNQRCFGGPLTLGYRQEASGLFESVTRPTLGFVPPRAEVAGELLAGAWRGLFVGAPFLALSVAALLVLVWRLCQGRRPAGWELASWAVVGGTLLYNASMTYWEGGFAAGPRFLIPALPFWVLLLAPLPRALRLFALPLVTLSVGLQLAVTATNPEVPKLYRRPWTEYTLPRLVAGELGVSRQTYRAAWPEPGPEGERAAFNWGERLGLPGPWSLAPLLACWAAAAAGVAWRVRRAGRP